MTTKPSEANDRDALLDALTDVVGGQLGKGGSFAHHRDRKRTEDILLLLLRAGRVVPAHQRVWSIDIPADDVAAVRAAGGFITLDEYRSAQAAR